MPRWSLGLVAAALIAQWLPGAADLLVYDRAAIARGELWRIVTGHCVHFSATHLLNNLAVLVPAAWLVETRYRADAGALVLGAASAIGIALLVAEPGMLRFGGASGIALALLVHACLRGLHENHRWRTVCLIVLAIVAAKFAAELAGWHWRDWQVNEGFVPAMLSHVVGMATGSAFYLWRTLGTGCRSPRPNPRLEGATSP